MLNNIIENYQNFKSHKLLTCMTLFELKRVLGQDVFHYYYELILKMIFVFIWFTFLFSLFIIAIKSGLLCVFWSYLKTCFKSVEKQPKVHENASTSSTLSNTCFSRHWSLVRLDYTILYSIPTFVQFGSKPVDILWV